MQHLRRVDLGRLIQNEWNRSSAVRNELRAPALERVLREHQMKDILAHLDKLRADAAECAMIRDLATDREKRELFARLADHLHVLAAEVERAIQQQKSADRSR